MKNQAPDTAEALQPMSGLTAKTSELKEEKPRPAARSVLIDAVRGMAISLVALGHTNQGIQHRLWWGTSNMGYRLDGFIYAFHMPAFFFVSGIFLCASVRKRGPGRFTMERIRTLIYPYLLWSVISEGSVRVLSQFVSQHPLTLKQFLMEIVVGGGIWFLPALFLCQMLGMSLHKLPGAAVFALAVLAYYFYPATGITFLNMGLEFFPFVAAGMWVGLNYERMEKVPRWLAFVGGVILFGVLWLAISRMWTTYKNIILLAGMIGTLMLVMLARSLGRSKIARVFAWAGEASLAIYLMGEYGQGLIRQLLLFGHITEPYTQLILPTVVAIVVPTWVYQHRVRLHLEWLFLAPFWKPALRNRQSATAA